MFRWGYVNMEKVFYRLNVSALVSPYTYSSYGVGEAKPDGRN